MAVHAPGGGFFGDCYLSRPRAKHVADYVALDIYQGQESIIIFHDIYRNCRCKYFDVVGEFTMEGTVRKIALVSGKRR